MREDSVIAATLLDLTTENSRAWRNNCGVARYRDRAVRYGIPQTGGGPDIIGIGKGGLFVAVECKGSKTPLRPDQLDFLRLVRRLGGFAAVATPEGIEEL